MANTALKSFREKFPGVMDDKEYLVRMAMYIVGFDDGADQEREKIDLEARGIMSNLSYRYEDLMNVLEENTCNCESRGRNGEYHNDNCPFWKILHTHNGKFPPMTLTV